MCHATSNLIDGYSVQTKDFLLDATSEIALGDGESYFDRVFAFGHKTDGTDIEFQFNYKRLVESCWFWWKYRIWNYMSMTCFMCMVYRLQYSLILQYKFYVFSTWFSWLSLLVWSARETRFNEVARYHKVNFSPRGVKRCCFL